MTVENDYRSVLSGYDWEPDGKVGLPVFLTYSFETSPPPYLATTGEFSQGAIDSFRPLSEGERTEARAALAAWADASGLTLLEAPSGEGDIRFLKVDFDLGGPSTSKEAFAYAFEPTAYLGGDVFLNVHFDYSSEMLVLLHEVGHALGLKHPFDGDLTADTAVGKQNTVMSYDGLDTGHLLPFDVQAIAYLYGPQSADGTEAGSWSWDTATATLTQTARPAGEQLQGVEAQDVMNGQAGADTLYGAAGDDTLYGGPGADSLASGSGNDRLDGGEGSDTIIDGPGPDTISAGAGDDVVLVGDSPISIDGGPGDDRVVFLTYLPHSGPVAFDLADVLANATVGGVEEMAVVGGDAADVLLGATGPELLDGGGGDDQLYGLGDGDLIYGGAGADTVSGGAGDDELDGEAGDDVVLGGPGADTLWGGPGFDQVSYADEGGPVAASLDATRMVAGQPEYTAEFEGMIGSSFGDTLTGDDGANFIRGMDGDDQADGAAGDDDVNGNMGADTVHGGDGADSARGGQGNDQVFGDAGDDGHVNGNIGDDVVHGGDGNDTAYGGQGQDSVFGDAGNDLLSGDLGMDTLAGGAGADRFAIRAGSGGDMVADFNAAEGDRVQLAPGAAYTLTSVGGLAAVDLGHGDVLSLAGVAPGGFSADWIVFA